MLSDLRQVAVVESAEASNRLEGVVVAAARLKSLVLKNAAPKSRSEQEAAGYRDALALIHESGERMPFSEGAVRKLHDILYRYWTFGQAGTHPVLGAQPRSARAQFILPAKSRRPFLPELFVPATC